ncbi:unnamed protein product [Arctogadus glacialis]
MTVPGLCQVHRHSENHPTWLRRRPHHLERMTSSSLRPRLHNPRRRVCAACRCPGGPAVPLRSARINGGQSASCGETPGGSAREV